MSVPTKGEEYTKLIEGLRKAQDAAAMIAHLERDTHAVIARAWLLVSENIGRVVDHCIALSTKGLQ